MSSTKPKAPKPHITELPVTWTNWYQHINWLNCTFVLFFPLAGCIAAVWTPLHLYTALFAVVYYFNAGLGITAGLIPLLLVVDDDWWLVVNSPHG